MLSSHVRSGDGRSGTIRLAAHQTADGQRDAAERQEEMDESRLANGCLLSLQCCESGTTCAYFSGSFPSNTPSNSVIVCSSATFTGTPSSFIASR